MTEENTSPETAQPIQEPTKDAPDPLPRAVISQPAPQAVPTQPVAQPAPNYVAPAPAVTPPPPKKSRRGCFTCLVITLIIIILLMCMCSCAGFGALSLAGAKGQPGTIIKPSKAATGKPAGTTLAIPSGLTAAASEAVNQPEMERR